MVVLVASVIVAAAPPRAARAEHPPRPIESSIRVTDSLIASVGINNRGDRPICIWPNYGASTHIHAYRTATAIPNPNAYEGRPVGGCQSVAPGEHLEASFDLQALYGSRSAQITRICHSLYWSPTQVQPRLLVRCAQVSH
jgi:hypothetical protein